GSGRNAEASMTRGDTDMHEATAERLRAKLEELESRAGEIEDDLRHPLDADSSEQAVNLADDETLAGVSEVLRGEIAGIRAALGRIEDGSYGFCARCGNEISA